MKNTTVKFFAFGILLSLLVACGSSSSGSNTGSGSGSSAGSISDTNSNQNYNNGSKTSGASNSNNNSNSSSTNNGATSNSSSTEYGTSSNSISNNNTNHSSTTTSSSTSTSTTTSSTSTSSTTSSVSYYQLNNYLHPIVGSIMSSYFNGSTQPWFVYWGYQYAQYIGKIETTYASGLGGLYRCYDYNYSIEFNTNDPNCNSYSGSHRARSDANPIGYIHTTQSSGTVPLYLCWGNTQTKVVIYNARKYSGRNPCELPGVWGFDPDFYPGGNPEPMIANVGFGLVGYIKK